MFCFLYSFAWSQNVTNIHDNKPIKNIVPPKTYICLRQHHSLPRDKFTVDNIIFLNTEVYIREMLLHKFDRWLLVSLWKL